MKRLAGMALLAALVLALAAGCGGSKPKPTPKEELQAYVDLAAPWFKGINDAAGKASAAMGTLKPTKDETWTAASSVLGSAAAVFTDAARSFTDSQAPEALKQANEGLVTALNQLRQAAEQMKTALDDGTFGPSLAKDPQLNKLFTDSRQLRLVWKDALVKETARLGVKIPWSWQ